MTVPTPENASVSYVDPDPDALPGTAPTDDRIGERYAALTPEQRAAAGVKSEDGYLVKMHDPANEPNISKHANSMIPR